MSLLGPALLFGIATSTSTSTPNYYGMLDSDKRTIRDSHFDTLTDFHLIISPFQKIFTVKFINRDYEYIYILLCLGCTVVILLVLKYVGIFFQCHVFRGVKCNK